MHLAAAGRLLGALAHRLRDGLEHRRAHVLRGERLVAQLVDHLALLVHHVVVLEQVLADVEVVRLDPLLRALDRPGHQRVLDDLALLDAHAASMSPAMRSLPNRRIRSSSSERKKRDEPGIALAARRGRAAAGRCAAPRGARCRGCGARPASVTPGPSLMSVPRPAMFVAMVTAPRWPACATISASCWWYLAFSTLCLMPRALEHAAQQSRETSTEIVPTSTGWPCCVQLVDLLDDRVVLLPLASGRRRRRSRSRSHRLVGRDHHHVELVDLEELRRLGLGRAGHAGQLLVHAEVVLQRDRGERLGLALDLHALLGLDRLVQARRSSGGPA